MRASSIGEYGYHRTHHEQRCHCIRDGESGGGLGGPGGAEDDSELELGGGRIQSQRSAKGMIRPASSESSSGFPLSC